MFGKILVCSDVSEGALAAARMAAQIAKNFHSEVTLVHAYPPESVAVPTFVAGVWEFAVSPEVVAEYAAQAQSALQAHTGAIFDAAGVKYEAALEYGYPVEAITRLAKQRETDLIVMGSRGLSGLSEFLMGSVSESVLHHSHCSVLIVRHDAAESAPLSRILLAADASAGSRRAEETATSLAAGFHAALTVLTVSEPPGLLVEAAESYDECGMEEYRQRVADALDASVKKESERVGIAVAMRRETGPAAKTILRVAAAEKSDLIVLGSRGLGNVQGPFAGQRLQPGRPSRALLRSRGALNSVE